MSSPERRRHKRVKRPFTARIRLYQEVEDPQKPVKWDIVTVRDLSASGVLFNYTHMFPAGTVLELNISLPFSPEPVYCRGEVLRMDNMPADGSALRIPVHKVAVRFTEITPERRDAIAAYLAKQ